MVKIFELPFLVEVTPPTILANGLALLTIRLVCMTFLTLDTPWEGSPQ
jgi:hypothetical protein